MARLIAMRTFLLKRLIRDGFLDDKYFTKQSHISADHHEVTHPTTITITTTTTNTTTTNFKRRIDLSDNDEEGVVQGKRKKQKKVTPSTDTTQQGRKPAKKKTRPPPPPSSLLLLPPVMSHNMQHIITQVLNGTNPLWLSSKRLTRSDTNSKLNRFFLPHCEALEEFMTTQEKEKLLVSMTSTTTTNTTDQNNKKRKKGLSVIVIDRKGEQWEVNLKIWESLGQYVLTKDWNKIVDKLNMVPFLDQVLLWCFRLPAESGSKLCFAIDIDKTYFS